VGWGFRQSKADPCLYTHAERGTSLLVYVDDIATAAKEQTHIDWLWLQLKTQFKAKNLGETRKILGCRVIRDRRNRTLHLDQGQYLETALDRFGITNEAHKRKSVPVPDYESLRAATANDTRINVNEYQQTIGCFMLSMITNSPDIAFVMGKLSQYMSEQVKHHGHALMNMMRYIQSTIRQNIRYAPGGEHDHFVKYSDADWASDKSDRKSVSGHIVIFYGGPIALGSKKQRSVTTSSCESEYKALAMCRKQGQCVAQVFRGLGRPQYISKVKVQVQMLGDNQGVLALSENPHLHNDQSISTLVTIAPGFG
jgi:hypothetical protein